MTNIINKEIEKEYLYWLCQIPVLGAIRIKKLWERFGSFQDAYYIEGIQLQKEGILKPNELECFHLYKNKLDILKSQYHSLPERGIQFITPLDEEYPKRLLDIPEYPMGLYIKGKLPDNFRPSAAIVGARNCSNYGLQVAECIAKELSREGIQIISGLASGIDGAGHKGALKAGGDTYGVLGCGINICYPREHYNLFEEMIKHGGVISEYRLSQQPKPANFPLRNRIISGLSDVVLVVEAREKSGSLITVEYGLNQGKEIFAVPGRITDSLSAGCNQLIKNGANILTSPGDIIEYLGLRQDKILRLHEKNENRLAKKEKMVYSCLDLEPKFIEEIVKESQLPLRECMSILLDLELNGYIIQTANHYYGKKL